MAEILNIEKVPSELQELVQAGLNSALKRGFLGNTPIDFFQIENSLSGGKTGAAVLVARYGISGKGKTQSTFIRVLKIADKHICQSENEGYEKTKETLLDIFSQVEYYPADEFVYIPNHADENQRKDEPHRKDLINQVPTEGDVPTLGLDPTMGEPTIDPNPTTEQPEPNTYGILLYQDVGTVAASDLKGVAKYLTTYLREHENNPENIDRFAKEISLLLQKEVFLGLKKGLYRSVQKREGSFADVYGYKLESEKIQKEYFSLREADVSLPPWDDIKKIFSKHGMFHQVNFIHGDLNPENVLVWENERGFLSCKLIDFGEVVPKKRDNFTPLFWDFARLMGEMILNFVEEMLPLPDSTVSDKSITEKSPLRIGEGQQDSIPQEGKIRGEVILNEFWSKVESHFKGEKIPAKTPMDFIVRIYVSTLFDFINEAKSGIKDLRRSEVIQDYFQCQILFFLFFNKFSREKKKNDFLESNLLLNCMNFPREAN